MQRSFLFALIVLVVGAGAALILIAVGESTDTTATTPASTTTTPLDPTTTTQPQQSTATTSRQSSTTVAAVTSTTSSEIPPADLLVLKPDGLGAFLFGSDAEDTVAGMTLLLGNPDDDTGWLDQATAYGTCLGDTVRFVRWGSLQVFATDGQSDWAPAGKRHFAAYVNSRAFEGTPLALRTAEMAGIGTTVGDLRSLYPDNLRIEDDPFLGDFFRVDFTGSGFLIGAVTGLGASDLIESVAAGVSCGE